MDNWAGKAKVAAVVHSIVTALLIIEEILERL